MHDSLEQNTGHGLDPLTRVVLEAVDLQLEVDCDVEVRRGGLNQDGRDGGGLGTRTTDGCGVTSVGRGTGWVVSINGGRQVEVAENDGRGVDAPLILLVEPHGCPARKGVVDDLQGRRLGTEGVSLALYWRGKKRGWRCTALCWYDGKRDA